MCMCNVRQDCMKIQPIKSVWRFNQWNPPSATASSTLWVDQRKCCRAKTNSRNSVRVSLSVERAYSPQLNPDALYCFSGDVLHITGESCCVTCGTTEVFKYSQSGKLKKIQTYFKIHYKSKKNLLLQYVNWIHILTLGEPKPNSTDKVTHFQSWFIITDTPCMTKKLPKYFHFPAIFKWWTTCHSSSHPCAIYISALIPSSPVSLWQVYISKAIAR